ncbi:uncharacterized protein [Diadema antillarum]|uniref:uncharacterized protein n=1 Tax=Diadema antillarum TaxID=105358 RepID=UPI003A839265
MAVLRVRLDFRVVFSILVFSLSATTIGESFAIFGVTATPYGGGEVGARYAFLVNSGGGNSVAREVKLGIDPQTDSIQNPPGSTYNTSTLNWQLPASIMSVGAFRGFTTINGQLESATIFILPANGDFMPTGGRVTVRANVGETITLSVVNAAAIDANLVEWERFSTTTFTSVQSGGLSYTLPGVITTDAGIYGTFEQGKRAELKYSLIKLIVRGCPAGYWGPPDCQNVCDNCYNGGVCSDTTGECLCAPGFDGENCLTGCGESKYGWDCRFTCEPGQALSQCAGSHVCLPDPFGCSCLAGFTGPTCELTCPLTTFGAGCDQMCHCNETASCDRFTGECSDGECAEGWSGTNCQVPDICPEGFFGVNCSEKCNCLNNAACDKVTAVCYGSDGLCAAGYASNTVKLADCQTYEGCFEECSRTCHCTGGNDVCDADTGVCSDGRCLSEWTGPSCQTGIVDISHVKVNVGQPSELQCIYSSPHNASSLVFSARLGTAMGTSVNPTSVEAMAMLELFNVTFQIPSGQSPAYCAVTSNGQTVSSGEILTYYALPTLSTPPSVDMYDMYNATISWMGWKADSNSSDGGEGPIVGYTIYYEMTDGATMMSGVLSHDPGSGVQYQYTVMGLTPGQTYVFYVSASRVGSGGEGPKGPASQAITLPGISTASLSTSSPTTRQPATPDTTPSAATSNNIILYIVIPVVIVVCVIVVIVVLVMIGIQRRRRRKLFQDRRERIVLETQGMAEYSDEIHDNHNGGYEEKSQLTPAHDDIDGEPNGNPRYSKAPIRPTSAPPGPPTAERPPSHTPKAIPVAEFSAYVQKNRRSNVFEDEWSLLPPDISKPCKVASLPNNKPKNRYRNILAYDHSRVVLNELEGVPNSDYVNACYIQNIDKTQVYIATQGPNKASLLDFWRMVWKENVHNIIMVTNLVEDGKGKCIQYWPEEGQTQAYGGISVTCHREEMSHQYVIRVLIATNGEESRTVKQFHYRSWPDKGVPRFAAPILRMIADVNGNQDNSGNQPLLVHCSAGAGRTGVVIAVDSIIHEARKSRVVDIFSFVKSMRDSRPQMVQTPEQYAFVHEAVLEALLCQDTYIPAREIPSRVEQLQWPHPDTEKTAVQEEFEVLGIVSADTSNADKLAGNSPENKGKNRFQDIIPQDRCRPYLMTPGESNSTNYVNASYIPGYSKKNGFITTQMPLANTVLDFWRLVYDYHINTIVMLNQLSDETCSIYWPVNTRAVTFGPFTVTHKGSENMNQVKVRTLELGFKEEERQIRQFEVQNWPHGGPDPDAMNALLQLMNYLHSCELQRDMEGVTGPTGNSPPILVHCMSGVHESGVFCTTMNCLEQLQNESAIDVFQNLRVLRLARPNLVPNLKDYLLCYQLLSHQYTLLEPASDEDQDYENRPPVSESLYQNVDFSRMDSMEGQPVASVC